MSTPAPTQDADAPLVSVVMSVRDGERFLAPAVLSILGQTLPDFELVVVDDGSRDGTGAMLARLAARDPRMRVLTQPPCGLVAALNRGCGQARGRYLARMDADDVALPRRLEKQVAQLEAQPGLSVLGSAAEFIDAEDRPLPGEATLVGHERLMQALRAGSCPLIHPSVMMRRAAFEAAGGYRRGAPHAEDFDLWLRMGEAGRLDNLPEPLLRYRRHAQQVSIRHFRQQALSNLAARASAQARLAGRPDPLAGRDTLDDGVLAALGITTAQQARAFARAALTSVRSLADAGDLVDARALLQALHEADARRRLDPDQRADMLLEQAHLDWRGGHLLSAAGTWAHALLTRPRIAVRPLKGRLRLGPHSP